MLYVSYENDIGTLRFNGGSEYEPWKVIDIEGLGLASKSFNSVSYPTHIGQSTLSETVGSRTITIRCDVHSHNGNQHEISKALKILNEPGHLVLRTGYTTRKIEARCTAAEQGERHGNYQVFVLQFVCDYPYFEDQKTTVIPIFQVENLIGSGTRWYCNENNEITSEMIEPGTFKLPCMFSLLTTDADVLNLGDVNTEPVIIITMLGDIYTGSNAGVLKIENTTTNQKLELSFQANDGDVITIDVPKRRIYNQKEKNLISSLSEDSFLSDFWLKKAKNHILVTNNITVSCTVVCKYSNKYIEVVIV